MAAYATSRASRLTRWGAAVAVLVVGLGITALVATMAMADQEQRAQSDAEQTADVMVEQLETSILAATSISDALRAYVVGLGGNLPQGRTQEFMRQLMQGVPLVRSMSIAPNNVIRFIEPIRGNEAALNLDFSTIPEQWEPITRIIQTREPALLGPFPLVQGGLGLAYREPVELPLTFYWGLVSTVIDADAYFTRAVELTGADPGRVAIRTEGDHEAVWGDQEVFDDGAVIAPARPLGVAWEVGVLPEPIDQAVDITIMVFGALLSIALAVLAYVLVGSRQSRNEVTARLSSLSQQTPGLLFQLRVQPGGTLAMPYASERLTTLFGLSPAQVAQDASPLWERIARQDVERATSRVRASIADGTPWQDRIRITTADGRTRWFQTDASPAVEPTGGAVLNGYLVDVTDEMAADAQMRISASVFDSTHDGVIIMDARGRITDVNRGFSTLTGYSLDDVRGEPLQMLGSDLTPDDVYDDVRATLDRDGFWRGELVNRDRDGRVSAQAVTVTAVTDDAGRFSHYVAILSALSTLRDDLVTGLPGRQVADDRLTQAVERARAAGSRVALLIVGLDRFRDVNEALGHRVGDLVLKEASLRLRGAIAEPQTVARLSGDEFAAILTDEASPNLVVGAASRIADALGEPFLLGGREVRLTASIGIAVFPDDARTAAELLTAASQALRAAKESGRDRYSYFTPTMQEQAQERARLTHELHRAVRHDELRLMLQPVVDLRTGRTVKAEALVRWDHPELGLISPQRFIPLAEASGQVTVVGDWVFGRVLDILPPLRRLREGFAIGFNLSPAEIADEGDVHGRRIAFMRERGIPGEALVAEITEGTLLNTSEAERRNLLAYRDAGIGFAIDDFGTGYSSLAYLQSLDVDYMKIDQTFVAGLEEGSGSQSLCVAIVTMAHALGLRVIAEGVEETHQRDLLAEMGCDLAQGFLFSPPISAAELIARLEAERDEG